MGLFRDLKEDKMKNANDTSAKKLLNKEEAIAEELEEIEENTEFEELDDVLSSVAEKEETPTQ